MPQAPGKPSRSSYDVIVVGGGHNGLVAAAYLAKAGQRVLVLERRHVLGGAAVSEELHPGFTFSVCSYVVSLFRPHIIRDLDLPRHGLEIIPLECSFLPLPDGRSLARWGDKELTRREIEIANDLGPQERNDIRADGELETGKDLFGDGGAAEHVASLEHEHLASRACQVGGAGQPVVSPANDDGVITRFVAWPRSARHWQS